MPSESPARVTKATKRVRAVIESTSLPLFVRLKICKRLHFFKKQARASLYSLRSPGASPILTSTIPGGIMRALLAALLLMAATTALTQNRNTNGSHWRVLFDGKSLDAWRGFKTEAVPNGWKIVDGTLAKDSSVGDIVSKDEFGDFDLELEWKIGEAGNAGIFYRGTEEYNHIYWSGPEYQLLDDIKGADNKTRLTCAGAAYAIYPSPEGHLKPVGEWNHTRIVARGAHVEHWLNGVKLLEFELWSPDWEAKVKASKFSAYPNFGRARNGYLALQGDHAGTLAFRNIRIRKLF